MRISNDAFYNCLGAFMIDLVNVEREFNYFENF